MKNLTSKQTIFSLSSGAGIAGVAVIRVSGPNVVDCINLMCKSRVKPGRVALRKIFHPVTGLLLDEGFVLWFPGPGSFTGEDIVEFQIHGGRATISAVVDALSAVKGCRQAESGEFTRRAFLNGRLDLIEIEGLGDLIHAQTEAQRRQALNQSKGQASETFNKWRKELTGVLAYLEASIDFMEEDDVSENALAGFREKLIHLRNDMEKHLVDGVRGEIVREGVRVVLVGEPNVGKSSIINYLAQRDIAIVSETPGTTRDVLEVQLDLDGIPVTLSDTAGLRDVAENDIERQGIQRTRALGHRADLLLWVTISGLEIENKLLQSDAARIVVMNKSDLPAINSIGNMSGALRVSAKTGDGMDLLVETISKKVTDMFGGLEPALITRERQKSALSMCIESIDDALTEEAGSLELTAEQLRLAANHLARLVGRIDVEDLLDVIFRDFCVGK